jgi:hypothetical protein
MNAMTVEGSSLIPAARIPDLTFTVGSPFSVHCHQVFTCWPVCCCLFNNLINAMTNNQPNQSLSYYYVLLPWRQFATLSFHK